MAREKKSIPEAEVVFLQKRLDGSIDPRVVAGKVVGRVDHEIPGEGQLQSPTLTVRGGAQGQHEEKMDQTKSTDSNHLCFIVAQDPGSTSARGKKYRQQLSGLAPAARALLDFSGFSVQ